LEQSGLRVIELSGCFLQFELSRFEGEAEKCDKSAAAKATTADDGVFVRIEAAKIRRAESLGVE